MRKWIEFIINLSNKNIKLIESYKNAHLRKYLESNVKKQNKIQKLMYQKSYLLKEKI